MTEWFEELPDGCPPVVAEAPNGRPLYRVVSSFPPPERDFFSQRALAPSRQFRGVDECRTRSVSLFDHPQRCAELLKLPLHRGKLIACMKLPDSAGVIRRTGGTPGHFSWWRRTGFDPLDVVELVS